MNDTQSATEKGKSDQERVVMLPLPLVDELIGHLHRVNHCTQLTDAALVNDSLLFKQLLIKATKDKVT